MFDAMLPDALAPDPVDRVEPLAVVLLPAAVGDEPFAPVVALPEADVFGIAESTVPVTSTCWFTCVDRSWSRPSSMYDCVLAIVADAEPVAPEAVAPAAEDPGAAVPDERSAPVVDAEPLVDPDPDEPTDADPEFDIELLPMLRRMYCDAALPVVPVVPVADVPLDELAICPPRSRHPVTVIVRPAPRALF